MQAIGAVERVKTLSSNKEDPYLAILYAVEQTQ